jgi:hypothetical protein
MAFAEESGTIEALLSLPHPAKKVTRANPRNQIFAYSLNLFIFVSSLRTCWTVKTEFPVANQVPATACSALKPVWRIIWGMHAENS